VCFEFNNFINKLLRANIINKIIKKIIQLMFNCIQTYNKALIAIQYIERHKRNRFFFCTQ